MADVLPSGVRSRFVNANGLRIHILEAGYEQPGRPCVLLLHGFPEIAYSWRHNMPQLASQGFHVVAPDQRGYGLTTGWEQGYNAGLSPFGMLNLVTDIVALAAALGYDSVRAVVGHDYGAPVAAHAALIRPDIFRSVVLMSGPFPGLPGIPLGRESEPAAFCDDPVHTALAALERPRKHYQMYYSTEAANTDMRHPPQGLRAFIRAYFHCKSADWKPNRPYRLNGWNAAELSKIPTYYIMERDKSMPETVSAFMPGEDEIRSCAWLTESELDVYRDLYERTGFQGGLNWYRCDAGGLNARATRLFAGKTVDVPALFIAGDRDWGAYQKPGFIEAMSERACTDFRGCHFVENAGHWVQQEQPERTNSLLLEFLLS